MKLALVEHDTQHQGIFHQAMVLCQTIRSINPIEKFVELYNQNEDERNQCRQYAGPINNDVKNSFINGDFRTLVICGKLKEGFDHNRVSVLGIIRNVSSNILFTQFVGRALRFIDQNDNLTAQIISDEHFRPLTARWNYYTQPVVEDEEVQDEI